MDVLVLFTAICAVSMGLAEGFRSGGSPKDGLMIILLGLLLIRTIR